MGVAAIVPILKGVGIAASAYSAVQGIKKGNLLQAVMGGVGAYMGVSSLMSGAASAGSSVGGTVAEGAANATKAAAGQAAGAGGTAGMVGGATGSQAIGAAGAGMTDIAGAISGSAGNIGGTAGGLSGLAQGAAQVTQGAAQGSGLLGNILSGAKTAGTWMNSNPGAVQGLGMGIQGAGSIFSGMGQQKQAEDQRAWEAQQLGDYRARKDAQPDLSSHNDYVFDYQQGRWVHKGYA